MELLSNSEGVFSQGQWRLERVVPTRMPGQRTAMEKKIHAEKETSDQEANSLYFSTTPPFC